jgi:uncharacterized SAM-binding protein YcdF (DUF218 family)
VGRRRLALIAGAVGLAALLAAVLVAALADVPARWLVVQDETVKADAALVLAGDPDYERTATAARLVLANDVRLLFLTGGEPGPGDSAESLRQKALELGVPPQRIIVEQVSHSTRESLLAIRPLLEREGVRRVVVVTSPYHQRRASWCARRTLRGIEVFSRPAQPAGWKPDGWWKTRGGRRIVLSEYAKLVYYGLRGWL